ncbi:MAG: signal peptidase I [Chloroflexi bacterium]|nr:signal peptidase I [Chloroflexota bacterium]
MINVEAGVQAAVAKPRPSLRQSALGREIFETALLIVLVYTLVNLATVRFFIEGPSMQPNFHEGQYLLVSRLHYLFGEPQRGDIVVFDPPGDDAQPDDPLLIKRLIALPGETVAIREGQVFINDVPLAEPYTKELCTTSTCEDRTWEIPEGSFFFMGDNRNNSRDSRVFGPVTKDRIIGEAVVRYWPPQDWAIVLRYLFPGQ